MTRVLFKFIWILMFIFRGIKNVEASTCLRAYMPLSTVCICVRVYIYREILHESLTSHISI